MCRAGPSAPDAGTVVIMLMVRRLADRSGTWASGPSRCRELSNTPAPTSRTSSVSSRSTHVRWAAAARWSRPASPWRGHGATYVPTPAATIRTTAAAAPYQRRRRFGFTAGRSTGSRLSAVAAFRRVRMATCSAMAGSVATERATRAESWASNSPST